MNELNINGALYGRALTLNVELTSQASPNTFQANPTLATNDAKISKDDGSLVNLTTLPTVSPASGKIVKVQLSASEMSAERVNVILSDVAGDEWCDLAINIRTSKLLIVSVGGTPTTTSFTTDISGSIDISNASLLALTGSLAGEQQLITNYNTGTKVVTTNAWSATPSGGDLMLVVGKTA